MDFITSLALSINNPFLKAVDVIIGNSIIYTVMILALIVIAESRNEKRLKILFSILIALVIGTVVKSAMAIPRPCAGLISCPPDYSFPSIHALVAFTLMSGFINKKSFPFFLVLALFVSFTRLNLGVHTFEDVAAALPLALVSYYIADISWKCMRKEGG